MTSLDPSAPEVSEPVPEDLVETGIYPTAEAGFDHGLVALAMGLPYWLTESSEGYRLLVPAREAEAVREQLAIFDRESMGWPPVRPREEPLPAQKSGLFLALLWVLAVLAGFAAQAEWPGLTDAGAMDARAVFEQGEVWRPVTALFLHADLGHVSSNLLSGLFLFSAVFSTFGRLRGPCVLMLAAVVGNLAAAALHYPGDYRSVGASTAVFAGLGMLTGRAIRVVGRAGYPQPWRAILVPLGAGLTVLALFGAGEQRVDVLAHATGFAAGLVAGFVSAQA